ncbi:MAG: c-type cytochrome [Oligoflexia bacterium]|nr:c-type cytochrome [Oligoflexia bacterium]
MKPLILIFAMLSLVPALHAARADEMSSLVSKASEKTLEKGRAIYNKHCFACHMRSNIMVSSPKLGDRADWSKRVTLNQGLQGTVRSALQGKAAMPAKGLCIECDAKDLEAAILFMIKGN